MKRDIEAEVTQKIIDSLEHGTVPWHQPWTAAGFLPTSLTTGRPYRGVNVLLLSLAAQEHGFTSPLWMTYNQARAHGGSVRKGEKSTLVVLFKPITVEKGKEEEHTVLLLRHYNVFNLEQTDDVVVPEKLAERLTRPDIVEPAEAAEAIWEGYVDGPALKHAVGAGAFYSPDSDVITLPAKEQFGSTVGYYSTLFHESVHSTGHASRLDRFERTGRPQHFGSERYAREELIAEIGAAMLRATADLEVPEADENTAAYIRSWLQALEDDKTLVVKAAAQAQKAVDRIVGYEIPKEAEAA